MSSTNRSKKRYEHEKDFYTTKKRLFVSFFNYNQ